MFADSVFDPVLDVKRIVGDGSPIELHTPMEYLDVSDTWTWSVPDGWAGFLYGVAGDGTADGAAFTEGDVLPVTESRPIELENEDSLRVVAVSGRPHGDSIRQRGPFVL